MPEAEGMPPTARDEIRVAIVDDHRLVVDGLAARLESEAPAVRVVTTASDWHDLLEHPEFPVDVVVLDLQLGDGIPITTKIRALAAADSAAVVISRHADGDSVRAALLAGALGFVVKTDSAEELVAAIHAAAAGERYVSEPLASAVGDSGSIPEFSLGRQEQRALRLYASGRSTREVAEEMQTTQETAKSYVKRARRKYREMGIAVGTRTLLRKHAVREGWPGTE